MNKSGYGHSMPQGYHQASSFPIPSHTSLAPQYMNAPTEVATQSVQASYQHPRNMIPGLGLGFATSAPAQNSPWAGHQADRWASSQPPPAAGQSYHHRQPGALDSKPFASVNVGLGTAEDGSEEGEISEGENEDLYDPREAGRPAASENRAFDVPMMDVPPATIGNPSPRANPPGTIWSTSQPEFTCAARERSGSYSPYLSPREIDNVDPKRVSVEQASHEVSSFQGNQPSSNHVVESPQLLTANKDADAPSPLKAIGEAKQEARDAILGLWPLNVRHHNFLEEGIDSTILGGLLNEMGLEAHKSSQKLQDTASKDMTMLENPVRPTDQGSNAATVVAAPPRPGHGETTKPVDKSEERKDRIARLLAAKGSKPPTPATTSEAIPASTQTANPPRLLTRPLPKVQSEKYKLLQQKMDVLRKSHESLARIRCQQQTSVQASVSSMEDEADAQHPLIPDTAPAKVNASEEPPSVMGSSKQDPDSAKPSPSIPGLFLSSTPQFSHQTESNQRRRPTPVSGDPSAKPARRPFGQQTESRPFLINVSDDEDDAEMDIDSPDQTSPPAKRPETLSQSAAAVLRESSSTANNIMPRHAITPASAATSPRSSGNNSGGEDLANMNKKIEAMKRRIAEAEARKKSKLLRHSSPATSHLDDSSRGGSRGSTEAASSPRGVAAPSPAGRSRTPVNNKHSNKRIETAPATMPQDQPGHSKKKGHAYGRNMRSLSTAASDLLPLIEARRREQLLKLQSLQMQIAKVEQEISEGMREEQSLKDLVSYDSDGDESRAAPPTAPLSALGSPEESSVSYANTLVKAPEVDVTWRSQDSKHENGISGRAEPHALTAESQDAMTLDQPSVLSAQPERGDIPMKEAHDCAGSGSSEGSADYEPPDADPSGSHKSPSPSLRLPTASEKHASPESAESAVKDASCPAATAPSGPADQPQDTPTVGQEEEGNESARSQLGHEMSESALQQSQRSTSESTQLQFVPYETPLQYFRAFRFHPEFGKSVTGGLRSLTYSNKIDVQREVCPDELAGQACPRGSECGYQHFEHMKAPDEQILLQLGAAGNYPAEQKQEYIAGLRQLLTDCRNRKVKDFDTISRGIVEYRAQFLKDRSKILPLGVTV